MGVIMGGKNDMRKAREAGRNVARRPFSGGRTRMRIAEVRALMGAGLTRARVVDICTERFKCSERTVASYIMAVREETRRDFEAATKDGTLVADILNKYDAIYAAAMKKGNHNAAVRCQREISELAALHQPRRVEISGPQGAPIETQGSIELKGLSDEVFRALGGMIGEDPEEA